MDERFIPLAAFVRGFGSVSRPVAVKANAAAPPVASGSADAERDVAFAHAAAVGELTLMRLAAFEAFERAKRALLVSFASAVLGRELALAPAELEALARGILDAARELEPVSIVVSPLDAERVRTPLPTRIDPALAAGDLIVEVHDGALESRFTFRLESALDRALLEAT